MQNFYGKVISNVGLVAALGLMVAVSLESCKPPVTPPKAEITVLDSNGTAISEAKIVVFCVQRPDVAVECNVADTQFTDGVGKADFEFENPSVLRVFIEKYNTVERDTGEGPDIGTIVTGDTLCAEGFITLETSEVTEETFVLGACEID